MSVEQGTGSAAPRQSYGQDLPWALQKVFAGMNALGTIWILGLMVLINADVIGRDLLGSPVRGVTELVSLSIVGIVFLQLADTLHKGRFTRAEVLLESLSRYPRLVDFLHAVFHLVGAALMGVILWASWKPLVESIKNFEYVGAIGDFQAPVWPIRLIMLLGLSSTLLCFLMLAWLDLKRGLLIQEQPSL